MQNVLPTSMLTLFTSSERTLKNNKKLAIDQINVDLIKYSPEVVHKKWQTAAKRKRPNEITHRILMPLKKQGKLRGPTSNLQTIIVFIGS